MTHHLGLKSWATGALVLAAITACSNADPTSEPSVLPTESSSMTSSATPSSSPTADAASAAEATVRSYFATVDALGQDPISSLAPLKSVATSTQLSAQRTLLREQHRRQERQVGQTEIQDVRVQSINLDNSDPTTGQVPTVVVDVCWDVTDVDVLDRNGTSIVVPSRPDTGWTRYTVANYRFAVDPQNGWRVASGQDLKRSPCAAS